MTQPAVLEEPADFSLVLGGPLYQLFRRAHLTGDALELVRRRCLPSWPSPGCRCCCCRRCLAMRWAARSDSVPADIEAHVRFLIALPILIAAEMVVHLRLRPAVAQFVERRIVIPGEMPRFQEAIRLHLASAKLGDRGSHTAGGGLHDGPLGLEKPDCPRHGKLVCDCGCGNEFHARRVLVCVRQRPDLPVHTGPLVFSILPLALVPVAGLEAGSPPHSHPPGPGRRAQLPGQEHLCLRADPLCPGGSAGRCDRQPDLFAGTN